MQRDRTRPETLVERPLRPTDTVAYRELSSNRPPKAVPLDLIPLSTCRVDIWASSRQIAKTGIPPPVTFLGMRDGDLQPLSNRPRGLPADSCPILSGAVSRMGVALRGVLPVTRAVDAPVEPQTLRLLFLHSGYQPPA